MLAPVMQLAPKARALVGADFADDFDAWALEQFGSKEVDELVLVARAYGIQTEGKSEADLVLELVPKLPYPHDCFFAYVGGYWRCGHTGQLEFVRQNTTLRECVVAIAQRQLRLTPLGRAREARLGRS